MNPFFKSFNIFRKCILTEAPAGGGGGSLPPPETEQIVVEKWCYFPELYKIPKVREDGIENG